jgi:hypothetical protein
MTTWSETTALAPKGPSLAALMLARGVELAGPSAAVAAQAEDVAVIEVGEVPAEAPCSHPSCAHANPHTPCVCYHCLGAGHGWITARQQDATRARTQARFDADPDGVMGVMRRAGGLAPDDEPW